MGKSLVPWFFLTHSVYCVEWDAEPQLNHMCVYRCICINSDVRRLIVAMSRARLGLYVFARVSLFQNCFELTPAFNQLMVRPLKLFLAPDETYPPARKVIIVITCMHTHTHTHLTALCPGLLGWATTRKVKPIWILLKQETVSGSGISWAICKSAPRCRKITMPATHHSVFYRPDALPVTQPTVSEHWRHNNNNDINTYC